MELNASQRLAAATREELERQLDDIDDEIDRKLDKGVSPSKQDYAEREKLRRQLADLDKAAHTKASVVTAEGMLPPEQTGADARHWVLQVKSILRLAKGQGAMRIGEMDQAHNTVTILMKPQVYLDPQILIRLLMLFKKQGLAMVVQSHTNIVSLTVGPEGFLEAKAGAKI